jgi:hypothetical protein
MSQERARHGPQAKPADDDPAIPGEPGEDPEFVLVGDDDLGAADLGPLGPNATDPDADSGRARKITRPGAAD